MANDDTPAGWFGARLEWAGRIVVIGTALVGVTLYIVQQGQDSRAQLIETRAAIGALGQKLDDSLGKQVDRTAQIDRDWRAALDGARQAGARERQILENRVTQLEAKQEAGEKRSREDAVSMATMREQMGNLTIAVNKLSDLVNDLPMRVTPRGK